MFIGSIASVGIVVKESCSLSSEVKSVIEDFLKTNNMRITDCDSADVIVTIGGDGTFLEGLRKAMFAQNKLYIGINTGTLGFLTRIEYIYLEEVLNFFVNPSKAIIASMQVLELKIVYSDGTMQKEYAMNEFFIGGNQHSSIKFKQIYDDKPLQEVRANGIVISSEFGSTGWYRSLQGSLILKKGLIGSVLVCPIENRLCPAFSREVISEEVKIKILETYGKPLLLMNDNREVVTQNKRIDSLEIKYAPLGLPILSVKKYDRIEQIIEKVYK
ncbi:MAG: NAD(+)/NADH kinase [Clostridia bacterium]|nr:NAD(+)/NADH kinase [Clostridia bacterium]MDD4375659.1 NAD(+)/NADH kinase [Clostridia bacterium]